MPRKGITGHDEWVITEALATALIALEQLPSKHQPATHMDELKKLLAAGWIAQKKTHSSARLAAQAANNASDSVI